MSTVEELARPVMSAYRNQKGEAVVEEELMRALTTALATFQPKMSTNQAVHRAYLDGYDDGFDDGGS